VSKGIQIKNIAVFEPQNTLCRNIAQYFHDKRNMFGSLLVFPCGVHSQIEKFRFSIPGDAPSAAKIDEMGNDIIQCVAIDDVLQGFNPTFIKMDIEGAELEALKGAKNTITEYHPQLAICVYHSLSDIWEIPLLIKSFYPGYRLYLRSYNYMGLETVLYAFPE
jgi:FkbM family methyltransferase